MPQSKATEWYSPEAKKQLLKLGPVVTCMQYLTGFEIRKNNQPWRWVKIYKGDYGLIYSEGEKGKELVGWKLRSPFEFTTVYHG